MINVKSYKDVVKEWRWHATAPNNRIVGSSSEGYKNEADLIDNAEQLGTALLAWVKAQRAKKAFAKKASKKPAAKKKPAKKTARKK